jgi:hypothetical protein
MNSQKPRGYELKGVTSSLASGGLQFQGFGALNQLELMGFLQPSILEKVKLKDIANDPGATKNKMLRDSIQRPFDSERRKNSISYRDFLIRTEVHGDMGNVPAITLYTPQAIEDDGRLIVPFRAPLIAVDGETQSEARFLMRGQHPETGDLQFKITVFANESTEYAKIILCNYNDNGTKVKKNIVKSVDPRGHINHGIQAACGQALLDHDVVISRFGLGGRYKIAGLRQCQAGMVGAALGTNEPWDKQFDHLNTNGGFDAVDQCVDVVGKLLESAAKNIDLRKADPLLWQAAGAAMRAGRDIASLNLSRANQAIQDAKAISEIKRFTAAMKLNVFASSL